MKSFTPKFMLCKHGVFNLSWILNRNKFVFTFATNTFSKVGVKKPATFTEAVVLRCSVKKVFLRILQNSQENTCARVSLLIKLQVSGLCISGGCFCYYQSKQVFAQHYTKSKSIDIVLVSLLSTVKTLNLSTYTM